MPPLRALALLALVAVGGCRSARTTGGEPTPPTPPRLTEAVVLDLAWEALQALVREDHPHLAASVEGPRRPALGAAYRGGVWIVTDPLTLAGEAITDQPYATCRDPRR